MPRYDALVTVQVIHEYVIRLEVTAEDIADAQAKFIHEAQGMTGKQIEANAHAIDFETSDEGESRNVIDVFGIEELPETDDLDQDPRNETLP